MRLGSHTSRSEETEMLDLLNEAWTAWNQQWGATVATIIAAIALFTSQGQKILRLASTVIHWRQWRAITNQYRKIQGWHRISRAKTIMRAELTRTTLTIPVRTYANCLAESRRMATRRELEKITPEKPKWLNDYYVARALESLASEGKIVKATRYDLGSWPPDPMKYLFKTPGKNGSAREEANGIETNSICAAYQLSRQCRIGPRHEPRDHAETTEPGSTTLRREAWLKECAPPCEKCWEKEILERDIRLLVGSITKYDLADIATTEITGENEEFQEAVIAVCTDKKCPAEAAPIKEIVRQAIEIRRRQLGSVTTNPQTEWTEQSTKGFSDCLCTHIDGKSS